MVHQLGYDGPTLRTVEKRNDAQRVKRLLRQKINCLARVMVWLNYLQCIEKLSALTTIGVQWLSAYSGAIKHRDRSKFRFTRKNLRVASPTSPHATMLQTFGPPLPSRIGPAAKGSRAASTQRAESGRQRSSFKNRCWLVRAVVMGIERQPPAPWLRLSLCPHGLACWPEPGRRSGLRCARVLASNLTATFCTSNAMQRFGLRSFGLP